MPFLTKVCSFELNSQSIFHQTTNKESLIRFFLLFLRLHSILHVKCDDEEDNLLQEINSYRATLNLTALTKNDKAECLADEMADQFKNQPCTNSTGSNTIPGTETHFSDFPRLLSKCHLNVTVTRDGQMLPACVPGLVPGLIVSNFTKSQYSGYLNDTKYTGVGIGSENDWIVIVLITSTAEGSFMPDSAALLAYLRLSGLSLCISEDLTSRTATLFILWRCLACSIGVDAFLAKLINNEA
ncbi:unnamed protein product [Fraxinus pennsylvanica]|uniref:Uncharacterized GPI-anchored protein At5g19230-like domain-containing protein n=1 Tax=Fraxinus pennsylvanica TaxID=56036 RepID=A0AAD2E167_9LAMI|nr:unnamed protein product [Fraxinus pennsylvanica]